MSIVDLRPGAGISVIQASAGTGKTHVVTSLAVTAIADGRPLDQMLLMTFSRAATGELRSRVWQRLVTVESEVARYRIDGTVPTDDVAADLCSVPADGVSARHERLRAALADFDAATIATLHGFCHDVLSRLGFVGDLDREVTFVEDDRDIIDQVVDDLLVRRFHRSVDFQLSQDVARRIARAVTTHSHADIVPEHSLVGEPHFRRARFARAIREHIAQRKRELRVLGYDDLLLRLDETLDGPQRDIVRRRLQERFSFVVVDEFQDTDTVQWRILDRGFGDSDTTLILVGDPKQAIYAFRGADVEAYLSARRHDPSPTHLGVNWRSDAEVLQALDTLFGDAGLGHDEIRYESTDAAPHHVAPGLDTVHKPEPLRIRHVTRDSFGAEDLSGTGAILQPAALRFVAQDLAADVAFRLRHGATLVDHRPDGGVERRSIRAGDIAVLVRRHAEAEEVRAALERVGVPSVVNGTGSVFASDATDEWLTLLAAVESPAATTRVHSAVLGAFFGWAGDQLSTADDASWDTVHDQLHRLRAALAGQGPAAVMTEAATATDLPARILARTGGQRLLTDLEHVGRLLHEFSATADRAPSTLIGWLRERRAREQREQDVGDRQRQLDSDADAVQVWTAHRSKGLEFPIVYLPYLWRHTRPPKDDIPYFHDPDTGRRCVDVGGPTGGDHATHVAAAVAEQAGEEMRLAYVALTRARHQIVTWWGPMTTSPASPMSTLVFTPDRTGGQDVDCPADAGARTVLDQLAAASGGTIRIEKAVGADDAVVSSAHRDGAELATRRFDRDIDRAWRRTSYSGLTALAHAGGAAAVTASAPEHDDRGLEDERLGAEGDSWSDGVRPHPTDQPSAGLEATLRAVPSRFGELTGGARFGTMVHEVLEHTDFEARDLEAEVQNALAGRYRADGDVDRDTLVDGLVAAVETPLGPLVDDLRLRDIGHGDRLDEVHFEFPLAGGDAPVGSVTMEALGEVLAATLPVDDVLAGYPDTLTSPDLAEPVHGYLSGSIDLVARVGERFVVADYKSNWLGVEGEDLSAWHYRPEALTTAMTRAHYPLQAILYSVALHRFLRARVAGYTPETHLGGVLYLFLRGMVGPDVPRVHDDPCGVFSWRPPAAAIVAVSDLLDRGSVGPEGPRRLTNAARSGPEGPSVASHSSGPT